MRRLREKIRCITLRRKLMLLFTFFACIILGINILIDVKFGGMLGRLNAVYESNRKMNELDNTVSSMQASVEDYLATRSFESMENYYAKENDLNTQTENLREEISEDKLLIAEKNIKGLCKSYLQIATRTIEAKRGRNVELYSRYSEELTDLSNAIHTFIYTLNNDLFKTNSQTYLTVSKNIEKFATISLVTLLLIIMLSIMVISTSMGMIVRPLNDLARAANDVASGNFEIEQIPVRTQDEVGVVTQAFNQMVENTRKFIVEQRETLERENALKENELKMQNHLREAQLKYLQAQINPHFLFNTLNAGAQLAMMEDAQKTGELLTNTAAFFRYNVRNSEDATIGEEVRLVDNYIYICNVRFPDEIHYEKDVDETLEDMKLPSMVLQPLVENSFNYGIRNLDRYGMIELEVKPVDGRIRISIWDNGHGMSEERINEILNAKHPAPDPRSTSSNGVGIRNLFERLRLYFDNDVTFEIISEGEEKGTEIVISIPCIKG